MARSSFFATTTGTLTSTGAHCATLSKVAPLMLPPLRRSPWSNKYYDPEAPGAAVDDDALDTPSSDLRKYEEAANEMFDLYRERCDFNPKIRLP
eukprot:SAG11_NODE_3792_length_2222_cov_2.136599_1_plen_94_part_00